MAECAVCRKKADVALTYTPRAYCKNHFRELIEKRVRKHLRTNKLIHPQESYQLLDDGTAEAKLTEFFLERIFKSLRLEGDAKKRIVPWNAEQEIAEKFSYYQEKKPFPTADPKTIRLLQPVLQEEVWKLCDLYGLDGEKRKTSLPPLFETLQQEHPETIFSLLKSFGYIQQHLA